MGMSITEFIIFVQRLHESRNKQEGNQKSLYAFYELILTEFDKLKVEDKIELIATASFDEEFLKFHRQKELDLHMVSIRNKESNIKLRVMIVRSLVYALGGLILFIFIGYFYFRDEVVKVLAIPAIDNLIKVIKYIIN